MTVKINGGRLNPTEVYANKIDGKNKVIDDKSQIKGRSFDSIMIKSTSKEKMEASVHETARKTALKNVYTKDISDERVAKLKEQVHNGTYQVDARLIADRLMMFS